MPLNKCPLTNELVNIAFQDCIRLSTLTIPGSVQAIADQAFQSCSNLIGVYFRGNAPAAGAEIFNGANHAINYYLPGTTGWGSTFGDRPTAPWVLPYPVILTSLPNFGIRTNAFDFRISWATNVPLVVEASESLSAPNWSRVSTKILTEGWTDFQDPNWVNYPNRFYRVRGN